MSTDLHGVTSALVQCLSLGCESPTQAGSGVIPSHDNFSDLLTGAWRTLVYPSAMATNLRLIQSGRDVDRSHWTLSRFGSGNVIHTEIENHFVETAVKKNGATLVIDHIDDYDETIMRFRESLEYLLHARVWINCYISASSESAFSFHSDSHNVIVLQLYGRKRWQVEGTEFKSDAIISPGECLSIPQATSHCVTGIGDLSVHLTCSYDKYAGLLDQYTKILKELGQDKPYIDGAHLKKQLAMLRDRRRGTSFPYVITNDLTENSRIRWSSRFPPYVEEKDGTAVVNSRGNRYRFDSKLYAALQPLHEGRELRWEELLQISEVGEPKLANLIKFGVNHDILICRS
jgi:hypothetical protein